MKSTDKVKLRTGLEITRLGIGTAPLGGLFTSVTDADARNTITTAHQAGLNYFDTAPHYGKGVSEIRLGNALSRYPRSSYVISSKVGRLLVPTENDSDPDFADSNDQLMRVMNFTKAGITQCFYDILNRMNLTEIDIVYIHDPDDEGDTALTQAYSALAELRAQGLIKAIGIGMNQWQLPLRFINETDIDLVLIAGRYSLLDQSAALELLPRALARNVDIIAAGVFNSGILANPVSGATYNYVPASLQLLEKARRIRDVLSAHGVALTSAAMQYPLRHSAVKGVVVGCRNAEEVLKNIEAFDKPIADKVWNDLVTVL